MAAKILFFFLVLLLAIEEAIGSSCNSTSNLAYLKNATKVSLPNRLLDKITDCDYDDLQGFIGTARIAIDLTQKYFFDKVLVVTSDNLPDSISAVVMNDYTPSNTSVNPASDRLCAFIRREEDFLTVFRPILNRYVNDTMYRYEFRCDLDASSGPYRYLGVWFNRTASYTGIREVEVYEIPNPLTTLTTTTALDTTVTSSKTVPETSKAVPETSKAVPETSKAVPETKKHTTTLCPPTKEMMSTAVASDSCVLLIFGFFFITIMI